VSVDLFAAHLAIALHHHEKGIPSPAWRSKLDAVIKARKDIHPRTMKMLVDALRTAAQRLITYANQLEGADRTTLDTLTVETLTSPRHDRGTPAADRRIA
jgi:hypothetical protein